MKKFLTRFGIVLSLVAAASLFVHAGSAHADAGAEHACGVCHVVTGVSSAPAILVAPAAFNIESVAVSESPSFSSVLSSLLAGRGPPSSL